MKDNLLKNTVLFVLIVGFVFIIVFSFSQLLLLLCISGKGGISTYTIYSQDAYRDYVKDSTSDVYCSEEFCECALRYNADKISKSEYDCLIVINKEVSDDITYYNLSLTNNGVCSMYKVISYN